MGHRTRAGIRHRLTNHVEFEFQTIIFIGLLIGLGTMLQSAVGFGGGTFAVPLLIWLDVPLPAAITLVLIAVAWQTGWNSYQYRQEIVWSRVFPIFSLRTIFLPLGIWLLGHLNAAGQDVIKQVVGAILLLIVISQWTLRVQPRARLHPGWTFLAGSSSGVLAGLVGSGGPPIALWAAAQQWTSRQMRASLWISLLLTLPVNIGLLIYKFGDSVWSAVGLSVAFIPLVMGGSAIGVRIGDRLSRQWLRLAVFIVLVLVAVGSILAPLLNTDQPPLAKSLLLDPIGLHE